jgi:hypothetical protein
MKLIRNLAIGGLAVLSLAGCETKELTAEKVPKEVTTDYFVEISGTQRVRDFKVIAEDFNKDGNLDLVIGYVDAHSNYENPRLYFIEGDGKGNFTLKPKTTMTTDY